MGWNVAVDTGDIYFIFSFVLFNRIDLISIFKTTSYHNSPAKILSSILTGAAIALAINGIIFKFQSWHGTIVTVGGGVLILSMILGIALLKYRKTNSDFYRQIIIRVAVIWSLVVVLMFIPTVKFHEILYRNHSDYINALKESELHPNNKVLREKSDEEFNKMKHRKKYKKMSHNRR